MAAFKKGFYTPLNPEKYRGRRPITYRSGWEWKYMRMLDTNPLVTQWASEPVGIAYFNPVKGKVTRYFPDFMVQYLLSDGTAFIEMVEIKPFKQVSKPVASKGKRQKTFITEQKVYLVNQAKWEAALKYCNDRNIKFKIITEKSLFN